MRVWVMFLCLAWTWIGSAGTAGADSLKLRCQGAADRVALVVTNSAYTGRLTELPSTETDGRIVGEALCKLNFTVREVRNADLVTLRGAVSTYVQDLASAPENSIGFFYYSGHGAQSRVIGESYLIPANAPISVRAELPLQAVGLSEIIPAIRAAALSKSAFIVLDACRDVAFPGETMGDGEKGIQRVPQTPGLVIAYSTSPGETALANNAYSTALAKWLAEPGLRHGEVLKGVRRDVYDQPMPSSGHRQFPWWEDGILSDVVLNTAPRAVAADPCPDAGQLLKNALAAGSEAALQVVANRCAGRPEADIALAMIAEMQAAAAPPGPQPGAWAKARMEAGAPELILKTDVRANPSDDYVGKPDFLLEGKYLLARPGGRSGDARIIDIATGKVVVDLRTRGKLASAVAISPDTRRMAVGYFSASAGLLIDVETGRTIAELPGQEDYPQGFVFSRDGTRLVTGSKKGPTRIWDGQTGRHITDLVLADGTRAPVAEAEFAPSGDMLATASCNGWDSSDYMIHLWDARTGALIRSLTPPERPRVCTARFTADGQYLIGSGEGQAWIWTVEYGTLIQTLRLDGEKVSASLKLSADTRVAMLRGYYEGVAKFFQLPYGDFIGSIGSKGNLNDIFDLSPDGSKFAEVTKDKMLELFEVNSGNTVAVVDGASRVAFSPDGKMLASSWEHLKIYDAQTGALMWQLPPPEGTWFTDFAFSPDSRMIAAGAYDMTVSVWRLP